MHELLLNTPLTRKSDHATSEAAADAVRPITAKIALAVLDFARRAEPNGFTDDELKAAWPDAPESSYRKRRTELAANGYLCTFGEERPNRHGRNEKVWHLTVKGAEAAPSTDAA